MSEQKNNCKARPVCRRVRVEITEPAWSMKIRAFIQRRFNVIFWVTILFAATMVYIISSIK